MIGMNIQDLRKRFNITQEELAEKLNVSRQTLAKWEKDESAPDINSCIQLSRIFDVSLDDLIHYEKPDDQIGGQMLGIPPRGKYFFGAVKVGERGQIVIPQEARAKFNIQPGDKLLLLGDVNQGLALVPQMGIWELAKNIFDKEEE